MKKTNYLVDTHLTDDYLDLKTDHALFRIYVLDENTIRFRGTFDNKFEPEANYALIKTAWKDRTDQVLKDERHQVTPLKLKPQEDDDKIVLETGKYTIQINKKPFCFEIFDQHHHLLHSDLPGRSFVKDENNRIAHYSKLDQDDKFYGFGEKSGELNKNRNRMRMHNVDSWGWDSTKSDPLYKMVPFYIDLQAKTNEAFGMFYNNAYDSVFDMGSELSNYRGPFSYFQADGGEMDWFFIGGPTIKEVVKNYTDLTGKTALMPAGSFGFCGGTMFYTEFPDADKAIMNYVKQCRNNGIPCDGFFLSSGYTVGKDGGRYAFNWNHDRFSDPKKFVKNMKDNGGLVATNIKPGMLSTHPLLDKFKKADAYIHSDDDQGFVTQRFWGGDALFPDFTSESGRKAWSQELINSLLKVGITTIWNDNNEYEIEDGDALASIEGLKRPIAGYRPIMANMMSKTTRMAMKEYEPNVRPYVISRAGFAGLQRYAQTWGGDNKTSWKNLKYNIPTMLNMGLSGFANYGCDVGGLDGPAPLPEILVRWVQVGIFEPRFMIHSQNTDNTVTEPWMYRSYTKYIRDAIKLRYRLFPYLYSLMYQASTEGSPVMRPLVYEFQDDPKVADENFEFMFGHSLLVANVVDKGQTAKKVYLPAGTNWLDLNSWKYYQGGQTIEIPVSLGTIPMFMRAGGIVAESPQLTNIHNQKIENLYLLVEPSAHGKMLLYEDDGQTNDYKQGGYLKTQIEVVPGGQTLINFKHEGRYQSSVKNIYVEVPCPTVCPLSLELNHHEMNRAYDQSTFDKANNVWFFDSEHHSVNIKVPATQVDSTIAVNFTVADLAGMG